MITTGNQLYMMLSLCVISIILGLTGLEQAAHGQSSSQYYTSHIEGKEMQEVKSLKSVLEKIEESHNITFFYDDRLVKDQLVAVPELASDTLAKYLGEILSQKGLVYKKQTDRTYVIMPKAVPSTDKVTQQELISGTVTDGQSGETLPGVNVIVKGTTTGTSTDSNGSFELTVESIQDTLIFSFVGYQTQEVPINGVTEINVTLQPQAIAGEELVVVGYGTQKKENLTGAVTQIGGEKLDNRVLTSPTQGLQGQIPNLNISVSNAGGEPGATNNFNIRGIGSLSGGSPYVLVDGTPQDLDTVNPQDIENISVLKGAAASAIYGARAPYGVILVTTKQGSSDGEMNISYSTNIGWNSPTVLPNMANSLDWVQTFNQAAANSGQPPAFSDETIQRIRDYQQDPENTPGTVPAPGAPNEWARFNGPGLGFTANANTDWYDVFYRDYAPNQTHNLSVSGGHESINYYLSGGLFNQGGQMNFGDDSFRRYNLTANIHSDVTEWLGLDLITKFNNRHTDMPYTYNRSGSVGQYYHDIMRRFPTMPLYDPNGHILPRHIAVNAKGGRAIDDENQFLGSFQAEIQPLQGWIINADISYRLNTHSGSTHTKEVLGYRVDETTYTISGTTPTDYAQFKNENIYNTANVYTSYELNPGKHFIKAMVGFQTEGLKYDNLSGRKTNLVTDQVPSISTATGEDYIDDAKGHWATRGYFTRFNYNYDEKYLIEFNARYDGSSRFEEDSRWGFFPSVSAGYNIAQESFWEDLRDKISMLKIRGSYGSLGNHDVQNYLYISTLGINTNLGWIIDGARPIYVTPPGLLSSNLTWETASTLDLGLDAEMFNGRLSLTFDWYQRNTTNMFGPGQTYPDLLGTSAPQQNNADLKTQGYEISVGWSDQIGQIQYNVTAHLADNHSTVTEYRNNDGYIYDYYEGQNIGEIWGYTTEGLYQSDDAAQNDSEDQSFFYSVWRAGDVNYKDLNGDGEVNNGSQTLDDHGDLSIIGNSRPRYSYAIDLGLRWKGIDFSMLWQGVAKRDLWMNGSTFWGFGASPANRNSTVLEPHLDYWRPDNQEAYYPNPYMNYSESSKNQYPQTRYLQNGAYLRLKNIQFGYTLPQKWLGQINVKNLRIYFSGENLLTISPIMEAFDPEATGSRSYGNGEIYPLAKTLSIGMKLGI